MNNMKIYFTDKKLKEEVNALEHRLQTIENLNEGTISKVQFAEMQRDVLYLNGIMLALLEHLDVYPQKELVVDNRYMPQQPQMAEVFRIKSNKVTKKSSPTQEH
jgi:hypothetical protein